jgi:hypothetical protein
MIPNPNITQTYVRKILDYDPLMGTFFWRVNRSSNALSGALAGCRDSRGYIHVRIDGSRYLAHRLAFLIITGKWPNFIVDHIDGDPSNNCWKNLREATKSQNGANSRTRIKSTSGFKGVYWDAQGKKWRARIRVQGRSVSLGFFYTKEEAAEAYYGAALKYYGEFARPIKKPTIQSRIVGSKLT